MTPRWLRAVRDFPREHERHGARRVSTGRAVAPSLRWYGRSLALITYRTPRYLRGHLRGAA